MTLTETRRSRSPATLSMPGTSRSPATSRSPDLSIPDDAEDMRPRRSFPQPRRRADRLPRREHRRRTGATRATCSSAPRRVQHRRSTTSARAEPVESLRRRLARCRRRAGAARPDRARPAARVLRRLRRPRPPPPRPLRGDGGEVGAGRRGDGLARVRPGLRRARSASPLDDVEEAAAVLGRTRTAALWRWPIADSVARPARARRGGRPARRRVQRVRPDRARPAALARVCQVGAGRRRRGAVRRRQPRGRRGQARPGDLRPRRGPLPRHRPRGASPTSATR